MKLLGQGGLSRMRQLIVRASLLCTIMTVTALLTAGLASASPAVPDSDPDLPVWPFAVGTIAAVAVAAFWSVRRKP